MYNLFWLLLVVVLLFANSVRLFKRFKIGGLSKHSKIPSWSRRYFCYIGYLFGLGLLIYGLTEPYINISAKNNFYTNVRFIFAVDVSRSMVYAEDIKPNRLEAVKKKIKEFYNSLDGTYECSILPFAGDVNPYFCPITRTKTSFMGMLQELDWRSAPALGTDITVAMQSIKDIYIDQDHLDKSGVNVIILLSDGGKEEALATNRIELLKVCRFLSSKNFKTYSVGVGGPEACPLVVRDGKGNFLRYVLDSKKKVATSQLDEEILKQMAEIGDGKYYDLDSMVNLNVDLKDLIEKNRTIDNDSFRLEKFPLQPYLFAFAAFIIFVSLLGNKL